MLKIKDNVDLKELEKYGYKYNDSGYFKNNYTKEIKLNKNQNGEIYFDKDIKKLYCYSVNCGSWVLTDEHIGYIEDLIKDGLVKKVD